MSDRISGFKPLKPGRIHMRCPKCGRKQSNMPRDEAVDPADAVLVESTCPKCDIGQVVSGMAARIGVKLVNGQPLEHWLSKP